MSYDEIPVLTFVTERYVSRSVQKIVESWRIEPALVIEKVAEHFQEMGIYRVPFGHERLLMGHMIRFLRTSPEIQRMVNRATQEEAKRQRSRHAD